MLIGQYTHGLDTKKRLSLPAKFKKAVGETVVLTRGLDSCLFLFPISEWENIAKKLTSSSVGSAEARDLNRFFLSGAVEINIDTAGRILIPDFLKDFAGLKEKIVLAGLYSRIELWDESVWQERQKTISKNADSVASKLQEIGMF
jgi:MraZ protein